MTDEPPLSGPGHRRDLRRARAALAHLGDAYRDDYHDWLRIGMALRQLGPEGLELWDNWSHPSSQYEVGATAAKWASFAPAVTGGITLGTLFQLAQLEGWDGSDDEWVAEEDNTGIRCVSYRSRRRGSISIRLQDGIVQKGDHS